MSYGNPNEGTEVGLPKLLTEAANELNRWWMESGAPDGTGAVSNAIHALDMAAQLVERLETAFKRAGV